MIWTGNEWVMGNEKNINTLGQHPTHTAQKILNILNGTLKSLLMSGSWKCFCKKCFIFSLGGNIKWRWNSLGWKTHHTLSDLLYCSNLSLSSTREHKVIRLWLVLNSFWIPQLKLCWQSNQYIVLENNSWLRETGSCLYAIFCLLYTDI